MKVILIERPFLADLAVGAPYENNGAVYIFLGSSNGLLAKASQRIAAPSSNSLTDPTSAPTHMFGYGLSKGVDIDGNKYLGKPHTSSLPELNKLKAYNI